MLTVPRPSGVVAAHNVTCERLGWHEAQARRSHGKPGFGWDSYAQQCVRVTISGPTTVEDMIRINALRSTFGKGGDAQGVCRVWLCAIVPDRQTFVLIDRMVMRSAGFLPAAELNVRGMELHIAAEFAATHGLGDGLQNWTKQMPSKEEFDKLTEAS